MKPNHSMEWTAGTRKPRIHRLFPSGQLCALQGEIDETAVSILAGMVQRAAGRAIHDAQRSATGLAGLHHSAAGHVLRCPLRRLGKTV
ncbi:hypothetical protein [Roseobacter denitrificans]|nr:hypothetical protein [Roseobacter denitrificans]